MKTLAIRLEDELHGRLTLLAQLTNVTITDTIRAAIEAHLSKLVTDPQLATRVEQLLADIEREADQRKQVITNLFSGNSSDASSLASGITLQGADDEAASVGPPTPTPTSIKPPSAVAPPATTAGATSKRTPSRGGASSRPQK